MKFSSQRWSDAVRCDLAAECLRSSGRLQLRATGWSMLPTIWPGDVLNVEPARSEDVVAGDVILFRCADRLVAHRTMGQSRGLLGTRIQTQGDAVARPDAVISGSDLLGKVVSIVRDGKTLEARPQLRLLVRTAAGLLSQSEILPRLLARAHSMLQTSHHADRVTPCQN